MGGGLTSVLCVLPRRTGPCEAAFAPRRALPTARRRWPRRRRRRAGPRRVRHPTRRATSSSVPSRKPRRLANRWILPLEVLGMVLAAMSTTASGATW